MSEEEAIKIVKEFNEENRFRDCGRLNNAIDIVIRMAEEKNKTIMAGAEKEKRLESRIEELLNVLNSEGKINYIKPIDIPVHNYISEDKIREKIKELEEQMQQDEVDEFGIHSIGWETLDYAVEQLKELLEEK